VHITGESNLDMKELEKSKSLVKILARPKLKSPCMLAAWPGISSVSMIVATYLKKKLAFKDLAEISAAHFFDPIGVIARDAVVEAPQFPQSKFYYWKNKDGKNDIILFIGDDQPSSRNYEMAGCVVDTALKFQAERIYTCAAAVTRIHHTEQPKVWGVASNRDLVQELKQYDLLRVGNMQIAGLNGLVLGVAKEKEVDALCLLGEVPVYATRVQNPMAALSIVKVLTRMLGINIDTEDLVLLASEAREKMKQAAAEAMGEYIDYFTAPIWESGNDEEEEEEEE